MNQDIIRFHEFKIDIPSGKNHIRCIFFYADVCYVVYSHPYCEIHLIDGTKYMVESSLEKLENRLPPIFFRCNRSTLVNLARIKEYDCRKLTMENGVQIKMSDSKSKSFSQLINSITRLTAPFERCFSCDLDNSVCCAMYKAKPEKES